MPYWCKRVPQNPAHSKVRFADPQGQRRRNGQKGVENPHSTFPQRFRMLIVCRIYRPPSAVQYDSAVPSNYVQN